MLPFSSPPSESPRALPVVADGPAPLAKALMAELTRLKLENKPWPGGKALSACWRDLVAEARSSQPAGGHLRSLRVWVSGSGRGDSDGGEAGGRNTEARAS